MTENDKQSTSPQTASASCPYRLLLLRPDGGIVWTRRLSVRSDDEALELARATVDGHAVELWQGLRFIEHFDAEGETSVGGSQSRTA